MYHGQTCFICSKMIPDFYMRIRFYWHPLAVSKLAWNLISDKRIKLRSNIYANSPLNSQLISIGEEVA